MNRLVSTQDGGMPLHLGDLEFLQDAYKEAFRGILNGLAGENSGYLENCRMVGTGVTVNDNGSTWELAISQGFVHLEGEIHFVPGHTEDTGLSSSTQPSPSDVTIEQNTTYTVVESFDPDGSDNFKDGGTHDTYKKRRAKVKWDGGTAYNSGSPSNDYLPANGKFLSEKILKEIYDNHFRSEGRLLSKTYRDSGVMQDDWNIFANLQNGFDNTVFEFLGYYKDFAGFVRIAGTVDASSATSNTVDTLPSGYRPSRGTRIIAFDDSGNVHAVAVSTSGDITFVGSQVSASVLTIQGIIKVF